jgi:hypothetical protein
MAKGKPKASRIWPEHWLPYGLRQASESLRHEAGTTSPHQGGKGDRLGRAFGKFLQRRLPPTVAACRGHIADSCDRLTGEFDLVLFDPVARLVMADAGSDQMVVPVEAVHAVVEMRTTLNDNAFNEAGNKLAALSGLARRYLPSPLGQALHLDEEKLAAGLPALGDTEWAAPIRGFLVGLAGCTAENALAQMAAAPHLAGVLQLGEYYVSSGTLSPSQAPHCFAKGDLSLGIWLAILAVHLESSASKRSLVAPDLHRYFDLERLVGRGDAG